MRLVDAGRLRRSPARAAAFLAIAAAAIVGLDYWTKALTSFQQSARDNSALSFSDREVAGGNGIVVDQQAVYNARALIPRTETYRVITGDDLQNATPLTPSFVDGWYRYFLMPRRTSAAAKWIICYGCDTTALGTGYDIRWRDENRISIGRLR
jgi:hypothetical protein